MVKCWKQHEYKAIEVTLVTDGLNTYGCRPGLDLSTPEKVLKAFLVTVGGVGRKLGISITFFEDSVGTRVPMPTDLDPEIAKFVQPVARNTVELTKEYYTLAVGGRDG